MSNGRREGNDHSLVTWHGISKILPTHCMEDNTVPRGEVTSPRPHSYNSKWETRACLVLSPLSLNHVKGFFLGQEEECVPYTVFPNLGMGVFFGCEDTFVLVMSEVVIRI